MFTLTKGDPLMTIDEEQATGEAMIKVFELKPGTKEKHFIINKQEKTPVGVARTVQRIIDLRGNI